MTYLVTGGTGFIGVYVTRLLVQDATKVIIYQRNPVRKQLPDLIEKKGSNIEFVSGDITDLAHLIRTVKEYKVNRIIHLASLLTTAASENPHRVSNVLQRKSLSLGPREKLARTARDRTARERR